VKKFSLIIPKRAKADAEKVQSDGFVYHQTGEKKEGGEQLEKDPSGGKREVWSQTLSTVWKEEAR